MIPSLGDKDRSRTTQNRIFRSMLSRHSSGRLDELVALSLSSYRRDIGKRIIIELDRHEGNLLKADRCTDRYLLLRLLDSFLSLDIDSDYFDLSIEFSRSPCPDKSINTSLLLNSYFTWNTWRMRYFFIVKYFPKECEIFIYNFWYSR